MSTAESLYVWNYLKRKRWYYGVGFVLHALMTAGATTQKGMPAVPVAIFAGSAFLLMFDMMRGGNMPGRTLLSMPMTTKQLGRAWRFVAYGFPVVFFLGAVLLGVILAGIFGRGQLMMEKVAILALFQSLFLGVIFFALSGMPSQPGGRKTMSEKVSNAFFGLIWGFSIPALMFFTQVFPKSFADLSGAHVFAAILMTAAAVVGWFRADELVRRRSSKSESSGKISKLSGDKGSVGTWRRYGGMRFFAAKSCSFSFAMTTILFFVSTLTYRLVSKGGSAEGGPQMGMFVTMVVLIAVLQAVSQLRLLRSLPISRTALASWLVFGPLVLAVFVNLLNQSLGMVSFGTEFKWRAVVAGVFSCSIVLLALPVLLRWGLRLWTIIPVFFLMSFTNVFTIDRGGVAVGAIDWIPWLAPAVVVSVAVSWVLVYRLLGHSAPWRAGAMKGLMPGRQV
jgi:hypothetical protein